MNSASVVHDDADGQQDLAPSHAGGGSDPECGAEQPQDTALLAKEDELTKEVPQILESMNKQAEEVNVFERQMTEAQERYKLLLEQWSRLYEDLRAQHGSAIDRVRPYFDAQQVLRAASQRVQGVIREFSAAASQHSQAKRELRSIEEGLAYGAHKVTLDGDQQDGLSRATVWVLRCQQERDRSEREYARALKEFQEAQEALESWRSQIGDSTINRTLPCFKQLQQHQITLAAEQKRISTCADGAKQAKNAYNNSMRELDRINVAVHTVRVEHANTPTAGAASSSLTPEETPEATPELAGYDDADFKDCCADPFGSSPRTVERNVLTMAAAAGLSGTAKASVDDSPFA